MSKRVTITDLARITGFSKTTISHVVNDSPGARIRPETREMILKAAQEHNYVPNFFARNIIRGRTRFLGFLTYSMEEACRSGEIMGAEAACREGQCYLMIFSAGQQENAESELIEDLVQRGIEGLYASHLDSPADAQSRLRQFDIELAIGQKPKGSIDADCVFHETEKGFQTLADALRYHGHSNVGFVAPNRGERDLRRETARHIFHQRELRFEEFAVDSPQSLQSLPWIAGKPNAMTAVVCFDTPSCLGLMTAALHAGRKIPQDLSIVLVDSVRASGLEMPMLTQIQWRSFEQGKTALERLIRRVYNESEETPEYANQGFEPYFFEGATLSAARERVSA